MIKVVRARKAAQDASQESLTRQKSLTHESNTTKASHLRSQHFKDVSLAAHQSNLDSSLGHQRAQQNEEVHEIELEYEKEEMISKEKMASDARDRNIIEIIQSVSFFLRGFN